MWQYNTNPNSDELYHHGILGQKWGKKNGPPYPLGAGDHSALEMKTINKYKTMKPDRVRKKLQKEVNSVRGAQYGQSNRWGRKTPIGKKSKEAVDKYRKEQEKYKKSSIYQEAIKKTKKIDAMEESGKIDMDEYEDRYEKIWKKVRDNAPPTDIYYYEKNGRKYMDNYPDTYGKELTIAYLQDLGFSEKGSKEVQKIIRQSGKQVLD